MLTQFFLFLLLFSLSKVFFLVCVCMCVCVIPVLLSCFFAVRLTRFTTRSQSKQADHFPRIYSTLVYTDPLYPMGPNCQISSNQIIWFGRCPFFIFPKLKMRQNNNKSQPSMIQNGALALKFKWNFVTFEPFDLQVYLSWKHPYIETSL